MQKLNFPEYSFRFKNSENKVSVFDAIRKKFVILTPEEWVRQHVVQFLMTAKSYPKSYINVEKSIQINGLTKRYDAVVFYPNGSIFLAVECKAPEVKITQETFDRSFSGLSLGFGLRVGKLRLEYSYSRYTLAGSTSLFGLMINLQ